MRILTLIFTALFVFSVWAQDDDELDFDDAPAPATQSAPSDDPTVPPPDTAPAVAEDPDPSLEEPPPPPPPKKKKKKRLVRKKRRVQEDDYAGMKNRFWTVGGHFSLANKINYSKAKITAPGVESSQSIGVELGSAFGLDLGFLFARPQSWGFSGHFIYQMQRKLGGTSGTVSTPSGAGIQSMILEGGAVYRWNKMFVPAGLNFAMISYTKASGDTGSTKINGGLGGQGGVGYILNDKFVFDGGIQILSVDTTTTYSSGSKIAYGLGTIMGLYLRGAYSF